MPKYVAFLRAVNVGGRIVRMDRLRGLFAEMGFADVETFIASGNVIFRAAGRSPAALERRIEKCLDGALGYAVPVFLRSPAELASIARHRPFGEVVLSAKGAALYIGFAAAVPKPDARRRLAELGDENDDFHVRGREVYWLCRKRMAGSLYSGAQLEKTLGLPVTFRSHTTIAKLAALHA
jgi:uncharacterized protein (DUF1697 family)